MAYLSIEFPDGRESRVMLLKETVVIGRSPDVDICIEAEWVSGQHATLEKDGDSFTIEDLGSSNGTYINYERVTKERLNDNDLIFLGRTKILYRNGASELEESAVELDILSEEQSGVFTKAPPPHELKRPKPKKTMTPSPDEVAELLGAHETSDKIPIDQFRKDGLKTIEPSAKDLKAALREANLKIATLQLELDAQRKRAEQEIDRLMRELTSWKSRYFDRVEESKNLRKQLGPGAIAKTTKFDEKKLRADLETKKHESKEFHTESPFDEDQSDS